MPPRLSQAQIDARNRSRRLQEKMRGVAKPVRFVDIVQAGGTAWDKPVFRHIVMSNETDVEIPASIRSPFFALTFSEDSFNTKATKISEDAPFMLVGGSIPAMCYGRQLATTPLVVDALRSVKAMMLKWSPDLSRERVSELATAFDKIDWALHEFDKAGVPPGHELFPNPDKSDVPVIETLPVAELALPERLASKGSLIVAPDGL